jgi:hypothetical protein
MRKAFVKRLINPEGKEWEEGQVSHMAMSTAW